MGKSLSLPWQLGILAIESSWEDYSVKKLVSFKTGLHPVNFANKLPRAKRIEQIFLRSLWSGKGGKSKRNVLFCGYSDGILDPENHGKLKYFFDYELLYFGRPAICRGKPKKR